VRGADHLTWGWSAPIHFYSGCQKNVPIAQRFFATTLMPPSFFRNIIMTNGIDPLTLFELYPNIDLIILVEFSFAEKILKIAGII
jgi:hypothetical protein